METEGSLSCSHDRVLYMIHNYLTKSIEQNASWEANSHSISQEMTHLWNHKVHYRFHKTNSVNTDL